MGSDSGRRSLAVVGVLIAVLGPLLAMAISRMLGLSRLLTFPMLLGLPTAGLLAGYAYQKLRGERKGGAVLLDCGANPSAFTDLFVGVLLLLGDAALICLALPMWRSLRAAAEEHAESLPSPSLILICTSLLAVYFLAFALWMIASGLGRLQICERGIWTYRRLIRWEDIRCCTWHSHFTLLIYTTSKSFFFRRVMITSPQRCKEEADALLRRHTEVVP